MYISDPIFTMFLASVKTNFLQIVSSFSPVSTGMSYFDENCTKTTFQNLWNPQFPFLQLDSRIVQWVIILTWLFKNRGIFLNITFGNTINMTKVIKIIKIMISIYCRMSVQVCWVRPPGDKDEPSDQFTDAHIQSSCVRWGANYKMLTIVS